MADASFDYVVVGAGSAGCVIAARLSEDASVRVALVEAGPADTADEIHIPAAFPMLFKSRWDWDLDTDPEPALNGRRAYLPRGRMLGGSSSMNAMIYIRGNRADYDEWAAGGASGWGHDDVLEEFRAFEDNERGADRYHGTGGPLTVSDGRSLNPLGDAWVDAAVAAGFPRNDDFNGASQLGVGRYQLTQRNGMRCSTAVAYLHPAMTRPNLTVLTETLTHRVVFESSRAVGVQISSGGGLTTLRAEREVIVSAGAYGSPQLLLLSGVGPAAQLGAFQIPVVADLPVGQDLQDHYMVTLNYLTDLESLLTALTPDNVAILQSEGRGPLTSNVGEAGGFFQTRSGATAPDVQFHQAPALFYGEGMGPLIAHGHAQGPCVLKPTSHGSVTLRTPAPDTAPRIQHQYLSTDEDRAAIVDGLRIALDIAAQPEFRAVCSGDFLVPEGTSDRELLAFAARNGQTLYHPTSTCAIGSVVDPRLRVHGVDNLRVADASVMPTVTRGNTNAPTILIAERAAQFARQDAAST